MSNPLVIASAALLIPLAGLIAYYDVIYRRIPNWLVLITLITGLILNILFGGIDGALASLGGCLLAFVAMLVLHVFGAMGAGDVKLFAAVGSVIGLQYIMPTFVVVLLTGGVLGVITMVHAGTVVSTMNRVLHIFFGLLPGWPMPRFAVPADRRHTIPYGVAITLGSLISLFAFRA
ncbi:MAG TPA: A24 family peptidase [Pyrinomonadaceae bacterium]